MRGFYKTSIAPPRCIVHDVQMILCFYDRPGSPPGNGWSCPKCTEERKAKEANISMTYPHTRFPDGSEL